MAALPDKPARPDLCGGRPATDVPTAHATSPLPRVTGKARSVQGFGCRPVETYAAVQEAGFRKPPRKEPAGADWAVCRLWGFAGAACCVVDALAVGISD